MSDTPRSRGASLVPEKVEPSPPIQPDAGSAAEPVSSTGGAAVDRAALQEGLYDLFCFLLTAARQLPREPVHYGPLRLTDAAMRLARLSEAHGLAAPGMAEAVAAVAPGRRQALDKPAALLESLDAAIVRLAAREQERLGIESAADSAYHCEPADPSQHEPAISAQRGQAGASQRGPAALGQAEPAGEGQRARAARAAREEQGREEVRP